MSQQRLSLVGTIYIENEVAKGIDISNLIAAFGTANTTKRV